MRLRFKSVLMAVAILFFGSLVCQAANEADVGKAIYQQEFVLDNYVDIQIQVLEVKAYLKTPEAISIEDNFIYLDNVYKRSWRHLKYDNAKSTQSKLYLLIDPILRC